MAGNGRWSTRTRSRLSPPRPRGRAGGAAGTVRPKPCSRSARVAPLEPDARRAVAVEHVDRIDEADLLGLVCHDQRMRPCAAAEEPNALEQVAGRHPGGGEDQVVAGGEVFGDVDAVLVAVTHPRPAFALIVVAIPEARLDLAAEAAQGGSGDHALGRTARAHDGVDAGARNGAGDRRGQIAVTDELDPGAGLPD